MKDVKYIALCLALVLAAACIPESLKPECQSELPMQTVSITAGIVDTKTHIGGEVEEDGKIFRKVYWSEGDKIKVRAKDSQGNVITENYGMDLGDDIAGGVSHPAKEFEMTLTA